VQVLGRSLAGAARFIARALSSRYEANVSLELRPLATLATRDRELRIAERVRCAGLVQILGLIRADGRRLGRVREWGAWPPVCGAFDIAPPFIESAPVSAQSAERRFLRLEN